MPALCVSAWCFVCVFQYCEAVFVCLSVVACVSVSAWCFVCVFQYCEAGFVCLNVVVCVCVFQHGALCVCSNTVRPAMCVGA